MGKYIQKILTKKMTRKEFLLFLGVFFMTVSGISALLKNLSKLNPKFKKTIAKKSSSFGSRAYGV